MRLTERGRRLGIAASAASLLGALYSDPVMLSVASGIAAALVLDAFAVMRREGEQSRVEVEPGDVRLRLRAGDSREVTVLLRGSPDAEPEDLEGWVSLKSVDRTPEGLELTLLVRPMLSGEHTLEGLRVKVRGWLGAVEGSAELRFRLTARAYPRVLPWIVEAVRLLEASGAAAAEESRKLVRGMEQEYYETREYAPGDSLRRIDWKATARHHKLMIKEFRDVQGSPHVIYDLRAPGPITGDEVAAMFLSTLVGISRVVGEVGLTVKSGSDILFASEGLSPEDALKVALAYVLKVVSVSDWDVYELVEPRSAREILSVLKEVRAKGFIDALRRRARSAGPEGILELVRRGPENLELTYVGNVVYDASLLVEVADAARLRGHRLRIFTPAKPWVDLRDLEEAYVMYQSHKKILASLARLGAEINLRTNPYPSERIYRAGT